MMLLRNPPFSRPWGTREWEGAKMVELKSPKEPSLTTNRAILSLLVCLSAATPALAQGDLLIGITWPESLLVSFDPIQGEVVDTHLQLNPHERFRGLAYDRLHHRLYALAQSTNNLYLIDPSRPGVQNLGNLRLDRVDGENLDAGGLTYDPGTDRLLVTVERWAGEDGAGAWSELGEVDVSGLSVRRIGVVDGTFLTSVAFDEESGRLIGLAVDGIGAWDDPRPSRVVQIDPETAETITLMETSYHTVMGVALAGGSRRFHSWVNGPEHFFSLTDLVSETFSVQGPSLRAAVFSAMVIKDFPVRSQILPLPSVPVAFGSGGVVEEVRDPGKRLRGQVRPGGRFNGYLAYDANGPYRLPDPNGGKAYGLSVSLGTVTWSTQGLRAAARNNFYLGPEQGTVDRFEISGRSRSGDALTWLLADPGAVALDDDSMLPESFDLGDWTENSFTITGRRGVSGKSQPFEILGRIDQVTPSQIRGRLRGKNPPAR